MKYFVMICHPNGYRPTPLMEDEWPALYDSEEEATDAANDNGLADAYGYEVYEWSF